MALALRFAARSDVGLLRESNEDSGYAGPRLLVVADGMGGHAAGEVASSVAIGALATLDEDSPGGDLLDRLVDRRAQRQQPPAGHGRRRPRPRGHGHDADRPAVGRLAGSASCTSATRAATCCATASCTQITHDHTFVQTPASTRGGSPPRRPTTTRSAPSSPAPWTAARTSSSTCRCARPAPGDRYLLCSDGLSGVVSEDTHPGHPGLGGQHRRRGREPGRARPARRRPRQRHRDRGRRGRASRRSRASAVPVTVGAAAETAPSSRAGHRHAPRPAAALRPEAADSDDDADDDRRRRAAVRSRGRRPAGPGRCCWRCSPAPPSAPGAGRRPSTTSAPTEHQVAIYQGLTQDVGPLKISRLYRAEDVALADLPAYQQEQVRADIATEGLTGGRTGGREPARAGRAAPGRRSRQPVRQRLRDAAPTPSPSGSGSAASRAGALTHAHADTQRRPPATASGSTPETAGARREPARARSGRRQPAHDRAGPARLRGGDRDGRVRRGRPGPSTARCPPACWATAAASACCPRLRHLAVRRFAPYADPVLLPAVDAAQRPRPGAHLPARPGLADRAPSGSAATSRSPDAPAQLIWTARRRRPVRRGAAARARPPPAAALHLHRDGGRPRPAAAAAACRASAGDQRRPDLDPGRPASPSSPASSPRSS